MNQWKVCDGSAIGNQRLINFANSSPNHAKKAYKVIHSDVCGPIMTSTIKDKRYFATFIDDKSHFYVAYLMHNKFEVATKFAEFVALAEIHTG